MSADPEYMYVELVPTAHGGDLALLERKLERLNEDEDPLLLYESVVDLAEVKETLGELRPGRRATIVLGVDDDLQPSAPDPDDAEDAVKAVVRAIERFGGTKNRAFEVAVAYFDDDAEPVEDPDDDDDDDEEEGWFGASDDDDDDGGEDEDDGCEADDDQGDEADEAEDDWDDDDDESDETEDDEPDDLDDETEDEPASARVCALIKVTRLARVAA